ncbi:diaminopimelate epimerase [Limosilactobacillus coleohominis 101-4-CHN]|uniref:Diaminopimelate epimerase n=1 Tax=Limosilactobacillus coleohominis 101-4-CHN TaxID=575594 RepID=C7XU10_9LACO|nr:diaminopimelate epimerase [Limosilactobacillus coleohominis]EEU30771.1 diaminopimelate epimerase [Limosilactobacillus coleohominis 101-4-CHN]
MVQLLKVHGSQNKFFILDQTTLQQQLTDSELVALTKQITNPQTGILHGADGLLVVNNSNHPGVTAQMRVINTDGSEASMCGNGIRTVARYVAEKTGQDSFKIETMKADLKVAKHDEFADGVPAYAAEISPVLFDKHDLPFDHLGHERIIDDYVPELAPKLKFTSLAVPNPHLIAFMDEQTITGPLLGKLGRRLNGKNPYYSDGVNVNFAKIIDHNQLFVRTFERGVGFTNACGTGMSATTLAFALTHPDMADFDQPITVYNPGGMVKTIVHNDDDQYWIELIGNATVTEQIDVSEQVLHEANVTDSNVSVHHTNEQDAYDEFVNNLPKPVQIDVLQ